VAATDLISKTAFLKFEQCPKAFYFYKRMPQLVDQPDQDKKLTFLRGHEVGRFAQQLFPGGIDASHEAHDAQSIVKKTTVLISEGTSVIYEAGFIYNNTLVVVDILCRDNQGHWYAYEVKSSLKVSENYLKDAYLQYYVLMNVLTGFEDLFLVTMNPDYVLQGSPDARKLFKKRSVKQKAEINFPYFAERISEANVVLERNSIPDIPIGKHCFKPYRCDFFGTCWKSSASVTSVFNLPMADRNTLLTWHQAGIREIGEIPDELIKKESLIKIREAYVSGKPVIDQARIRELISISGVPIAALDMEIWNPAIPRLQGTRPFEQIPFLVSLFNGSEFITFFSAGDDDQREEFAIELIKLTEGYKSIIVYDKTLEVLVIGDLARRFPHLAGDLEKIKVKITDIFLVFLKLAYYHPAFKNNFSLKVISSLLIDDISYPAIESGLEAMSLYSKFRASTNELERETIRNALVEYCNTDTLATFRLYEYLREVGSEGA
jgi:hypothetical protein